MAVIGSTCLMGDYTDFDVYYDCFRVEDREQYKLKKVGRRYDGDLLRTYQVIDEARECVWGASINKLIRTRENPCDPNLCSVQLSMIHKCLELATDSVCSND